MGNKVSYSLVEIKRDFLDPNLIEVSRTARRSYTALGMTELDVISVIQSLTERNFYKSMQGTVDSRVMHDVYKITWESTPLYIKFIRNFGRIQIMLVSCKEDESYVR